MLPFVKSLTSIDFYRDGGSMSISFISFTGVKHTLLFQIIRSLDNERQENKFAEPILEIYRKIKRVSPVTGLSNYDTRCEKKKLNWKDSMRLLNRAQRHVADFKSEDINNLSIMLNIATNQGLLSFGA